MVVDKPVIQYVVEEAVAAGITEILIITGRSKRAVEDHFDPPFELENLLEAKGKTELLQEVRQIANLAKIQFTRQRRQLGLADAIYQGKSFVGADSFVVLLGDTIIDSNGCDPCLSEMIEIFNETDKSVVATEYVQNPADVSRYGIIDPGENKSQKTSAGVKYLDVHDLVEKPAAARAPSRLAVASRYLFAPAIFGYIERTKPGKGGEIQITDSMRMLAKKEGLYAYEINGQRYDIGNKIDYIKTNIDFALKNPETGQAIRSHLESILNQAG